MTKKVDRVAGTQGDGGVSRRDVIQAGSALALTSALAPAIGSNALANAAATPFQVAIPDAALDDLKRRLDLARWPEPATEQGWSQGAPLERLQHLVDHWRKDYDWRRVEMEINAWPQFRTEIDGLTIHYIHARSRQENALPLILTHGWPGSVIEFLKVIGPLTDPTAHGGRTEDAFHVVVPSLPGFGFSDRPSAPGWDAARIARAWAELMAGLGYKHWVAQGGDWGAVITNTLALQKPAGLAAIHLNLPMAAPDNLQEEATPTEHDALAAIWRFVTDGRGYAQIQATRPQTIGYALTDSPVGLAAWFYEKFQAWTDNDGDPESALTRDEMLDDISLYWLTNTAASSARIYRENARIGMNQGVVDFPVGISSFPKEIFRTPRSWVDKFYPNLIHWNELDRGGHFAAFEQPELFTKELRDCFRGLRDI